MIRLFHTGDLHPNSNATFAGKMPIDPETGKNQALTDLRKSLEYVYRVATTAETDCNFGVIGGDVFDSVKPTMDEVKVIVEWVRLIADEMPVVIIPGNHDMGASGTMATALEPLQGRDNVHIMERPDSIVLDIHGEKVRVFGLPYPTKGKILASAEHQALSPEQVTALINHSLAQIIRGLTLQFEPGISNILLAHGSVSMAKVGAQPRSLAHDILIPVDELEGFEYVALNHIHQHQQVTKNVWYSGSLLRQDFGEEHEPKGFNLVEVTPGLISAVTFIPNPYARIYKTLTVEDCLKRLPDGTSEPDPNMIYRIKDTLTAHDYEVVKGAIEKFQASVPYCQVNIEIESEARSRDAGMADCLTMDAALGRLLQGKVNEGAIRDDEIPVILDKHQSLVSEVGP